MISTRKDKVFTCCFNCKTRFVGCHDKCVTYQEEIRKNKELNNLIFNKKKINSEIANYKIKKEVNRTKKYKKFNKY